MSTNADIRSRTWVQALTAVLALVLAVAVITQLRRTAPHEPLDIADRVSEAPGAIDRSRVTCQRRTADGATFDPDVDISGIVSSVRVTECPALYDLQTVQFVGEVIGDVLQRDGGAWVLVNDDAYALVHGPLPTHQNFAGSNSGLAVWVPTQYVALIDAVGGPDRRGTILQIDGVIHRADPADGGGLTLRASAVTQLAPGRPLPHPLHNAQLIVAALAAMAAVAVTVLERRVTRRR